MGGGKAAVKGQTGQNYCEPASEATFIEKNFSHGRVLRFPIGWPSGLWAAEPADCLDDCKVLDHALNWRAHGRHGECTHFSPHHEVVSLATNQTERWPPDSEKPL